MYAKIINGKIESVSRKPNWRMDDGSPISDEELAKRGRLEELIDELPEIVWPE